MPLKLFFARRRSYLAPCGRASGRLTEIEEVPDFQTNEEFTTPSGVFVEKIVLRVLICRDYLLTFNPAHPHSATLAGLFGLEASR